MKDKNYHFWKGMIIGAYAGFFLGTGVFIGGTKLGEYLHKRSPSVQIADHPNGLHVNSNPLLSEKSLESIATLSKSFVETREHTNNSGEDITRNLVSLESDLSGKHYGPGSGLLLTEDGWVVTSYHFVFLIESELEELARDFEKQPYSKKALEDYSKSRIRTQEGLSYAIDPTVWATSPDHDIALMKAVIPEKPKPMNFTICDLKQGDTIRLYGLKDYILYNQMGKITETGRNIVAPGLGSSFLTQDGFLSNAYGVPGFSGGIFATPDGRIAGLATYAEGPRSDAGDAIFIGGTKAKYIVKLVKETVEKLKRMKTKKDN